MLRKKKIDGSKLALRISPFHNQIIQLISSCQLRLPSVSGLVLMGIPSVFFLALPPALLPQGDWDFFKEEDFTLQIYSCNVVQQ